MDLRLGGLWLMAMVGCRIVAVKAGDPLSVLHHGVFCCENILSRLLLQLVQLPRHPSLHGCSKVREQPVVEILTGNPVSPFGKVHPSLSAPLAAFILSSCSSSGIQPCISHWGHEQECIVFTV